MDVETIVMELVVNGGNARSLALEAIDAAKDKDFAAVEKKMKECEEVLNEAHHFQTKLISEEAGGNKTEWSLLMVHGQDHLMNAMTVRDLALHMIEMYKVMYS